MFEPIALLEIDDPAQGDAHLFQCFRVLRLTAGLDFGSENKSSAKFQLIAIAQFFTNQIQCLKKDLRDNFDIELASLSQLLYKSFLRDGLLVDFMHGDIVGIS